MKLKRKWAWFDRAFGKLNPVPTGEIIPRKYKKRKKAQKKAIKVIVEITPVIKVRKRRKVSIQRAIRNTKEYKLWRQSIIDRDKHACLFCGCKERLEVDHIIPASKRPDLIMTDDNARVLCKPCHSETPSYPKSLAIISRSLNTKNWPELPK